MAKKKQPATAQKEQIKPTLIEALKFIKLAQLDTGAPQHRHCVIYGQWAYGCDGVLTTGHPIEEDLTLAPHTVRLIQALERCDGNMAMVALPSGLSVKAGRFRAVVPCFPLSDMPNMAADPPIAAINDNLRAGFAAVGPVVTEGALKVNYAAVRLGHGTCVGTNGSVLIEYWHGLDLPTVLLPKQAIKAIEAVKKPLAQFGFSPTTATFYFDDGSWIKTQLYNEKYVQYEHILNKPSTQEPVNVEMFAALRQLKPFTEESGGVMFSGTMLHTSRHSDVKGSTYELAGMPTDRAFNLDYLLLLESIAKTVSYGVDKEPLRFFGDNVRGAIAPMNMT